MNTFFFLSFPLVFFLGFSFMFLSLLLKTLGFSLFFQWDFMVESFKVSFPIFLDFMSCFFIGMVMIISSSILFYSNFYMESDLNKTRFFYLMILFVLSMVFLVLSPNFFCMLLGWDGLGLVSYCLVIYYQNYKSLNAGLVTALTNRVGDVFILGTISLCWFKGSWNYMNFFLEEKDLYMMYFFILAAMTKSAQIPFSAWLPAAMAAPTPVSSLVHSSTLVTAGVYILIRFFNSLKSSGCLNFLLVMSLLTMIMSGLSGVYENDLKKIIALSTLSQLGFMMATLSVGLQDLTFFHLVTHACFKALLFMSAGIFIHSFLDNQDIRYYGLLNNNFSLVLSMFNVANLSLCGFPFLSGFFSKDLILEIVFMSSLNFVVFFLFVFGTFLTVFYSLRLFYYLTLKFKFSLTIESNLIGLNIQKSLFFLYLLSISLGFYFSKLMLFPYNYIVMPSFLKTFVMMICLLSFSMCYFASKAAWVINIPKNLIFFLSSMWFLLFLKTDLLKNFMFKWSTKTNSLTLFWVEWLVGLKVISVGSLMSTNLNKVLMMFFAVIFSSLMSLIVLTLFIFN